MNVKEVFDNLSERPLIEQLARLENLIVVGDSRTLEILEARAFGKNQARSWQFVVVDDVSEAETGLPHVDAALQEMEVKAMVVASTFCEGPLYAALRRFAADRCWRFPIKKLFSDLFVSLYLDRSLLDSIDRDRKPPRIAYGIITTPRTGSQYLCQLLTSTRIAGFPEEHLRHPSETLSQHCGFDHVRFLRLLMAHKVSENRVFGTKFISHFLRDHLKTHTLEMKGLLSGFRFVRLMREDKVEQAISMYLAGNTNVWHLYSPEDKERYEQDLATRYSAEEVALQPIRDNCTILMDQESWIDRFLDEIGVNPLVVSYESFIDKPKETVQRIIRFLDIEESYDTDGVRASSRKLGSDFSRALKRRVEMAYGLKDAKSLSRS